MDVAIVGSGVAGLVCAHLLDPIHDVTLFEADRRLGGHCNTVTVDDPTAGELGVDTGFIVHNDRNYPNLVRLFDELGVTTIDTEMSFAVTDRTSDFTYRATNLDTLLARRRNATDPRLWRMLADILRFQRAGRRLLQRQPAGADTVTIGELLQSGRYGSAFIELHLIPMGAAVWSVDPATFTEFPALSLLRFLDNHGLLSIGNRPQWRAIVGGSRTYVDAIIAGLRGSVRSATPVLSIERRRVDRPPGHSQTDSIGPVDSIDSAGGSVTVTTAAGSERFDHVIVAAHSDQALRLLVDPTPAERDILGAIRYQPNRATLHTDVSLLSPEPKAWAAWNYDRLPPGSCGARAATVTYDLTTLQRLAGERRYLVSLNSNDRIRPETVIDSFDYAHPIFDGAAVAAQQRIAEINGVANTWFCGAWCGYGFHEDGAAAAVRVARELGACW
jgi:predicted NAD/FAD-binding protein